MKKRCINCGIPISEQYDYCYLCYQEFEDDYEDDDYTCSCGNYKKSHHEKCHDCFQLDETKRKKEKYGHDICPICGSEFIFSEFLNTAITNPRTRLIANLITHYRHNHQSWDKTCHYIERHLSQNHYDKYKSEYNNRAKRQILRKCKDWLIENLITKDDFMELMDNDEKTILFINKTFD